MASAQVLPNSVAGSAKKNELLLAGKRRLEEFRKKKAAAAAAAKNSSSNNVSEVDTNEKKPVEDDHGRVMDSAGAGTSGGHGNVVAESSSVAMNGNSIRESELLSSNVIHNSSLSANDYKSVQFDEPFIYSNDQEFKGVGNIGFGRNGNGPPDYTGGLGRFARDTTTLDQSVRLNSQGSQDFSGGIGPGIVESLSKEEMNSSKDYTSSNSGSSGSSRVSVSRISPQNSVGSLFLSDITNVDGSKPSSLYEDLIRPTTSKKGFPDTSQTTHSSTNFSDILSSSALYGTENGDAQIYGSGSYKSNFQSPPNHIPSYPVTNETYSRKSRPSFLDNLSVNRASSGPQFQKEEFEKDSFKSNSLSPFNTPSMNADSLNPFSKRDSLSPLPSHNHLNNSGFDNRTHSSVYENGVDMNHEFYLAPKRNEDFSTLEQHIEDLTQEKFSLQRALETSSVLAESLASENSSLTDSYNQQRGVVDQLKSDMENLQGEIKTRLAELDALRNDYANIELECNASDERAKLLASEVITLEEKALRLRSNELKLERQLENTQAEISAYKKRMSSIEKDRMDLQSTIEALQEEKKLLQSKLRKASTSGNSIDATKPAMNKKDISTSTEDLADEDATETSSQEMRDGSFVGTGASSSSSLPLNGTSMVEDSFASIPPQQLRMIQNINTLLSELSLEKQELVQALASESSLSSKLKELNNDLSRKLEAQTQRLELLTSQSMAGSGEHVAARLPDSLDVRDNIQYADEGDEVVERVLGWIMKLFPGGPSRRRTSKLL